MFTNEKIDKIVVIHVSKSIVIDVGKVSVYRCRKNSLYSFPDLSVHNTFLCARGHFFT